MPTIKALKERQEAARAARLSQRGRLGDVRAAQINEYLKEAIEGDYTAKDFRTWNATLLAAVDLATNGSRRPGRRP